MCCQLKRMNHSVLKDTRLDSRYGYCMSSWREGSLRSTGHYAEAITGQCRIGAAPSLKPQDIRPVGSTTRKVRSYLLLVYQQPRIPRAAGVHREKFANATPSLDDQILWILEGTPSPSALKIHG